MYSGPCFPRDNLNFIQYLKKNKVNFSLLKSTDEINNIQISRYLKIFNQEKKKIKRKPIIGLCGISYKENTFVNTKSPSMEIYKKLFKKYKIIFHDVNYHKNFGKYNFIKDQKKFFNSVDVIFICYKNKKFKKLCKFKTSKNKIIIDLWNFLKSKSRNIHIKSVGVNSD